MASRSSRRGPAACAAQFELPLAGEPAAVRAVATGPVCEPVPCGLDEAEPDRVMTGAMPAADSVGAVPPPAFGRWLSRQTEASGVLGLLAKAIGGDPAFSRRATPDDLRRRLAASGAEPELFDAVDDAEAAWTMAA